MMLTVVKSITVLGNEHVLVALAAQASHIRAISLMQLLASVRGSRTVRVVYT